MTPNEFSGFLKAKGFNQSECARKYKMAISSINNVARGRSKSKKVRFVMALELQMDVDDIEWPKVNSNKKSL